MASELSLVEGRITHLVDAIASGRGSADVFSALEFERKRKCGLVGKIGVLDQSMAVLTLDTAKIAKDLYSRIRDLPSLLRRNKIQGRQILRKLFDKAVICELVIENGVPGYRFTATGNFAKAVGSTSSSNQNGGGQGI